MERVSVGARYLGGAEGMMSQDVLADLQRRYALPPELVAELDALFNGATLRPVGGPRTFAAWGLPGVDDARVAPTESLAVVALEPLHGAGGQPPISGQRYEDLGLLGTGGMGEVRRVRDVDLNRTMAMKTDPRHSALASRGSGSLRGRGPMFGAAPAPRHRAGSRAGTSP